MLHEIGTNSLFGWNIEDTYLELLIENAVGNTVSEVSKIWINLLKHKWNFQIYSYRIKVILNILF